VTVALLIETYHLTFEEIQTLTIRQYNALLEQVFNIAQWRNPYSDKGLQLESDEQRRGRILAERRRRKQQ